MFKRLFGGVWENIKEEKGAFFSSVISFILIFTMVNIFIFAVLNADSYRVKEEASNQVIVYLKDMSIEEKEQLQKDLLNLEGIDSLKYISKDVALRSLEIDLNVDLSGEANPLEDSFFIYLSRNVNIQELSSKLSAMDKFSEIDLREKIINRTVEFSNGLDSFIRNASIFFAVFAAIITYNISVLSVKARKREIHKALIKGVSKGFLKTTFFIESIISISISVAVSYLIFERIRSVIISLVTKAGNTTIIFTNQNKELAIILFVGFLAIIMSSLVNYLILKKYYNLQYYKLENEEIGRAHV